MSTFAQRVSRRPQLRLLLDQQRTLGNRAVLRLIGVQPQAEEPVDPAPVEPEQPTEAPPTPDPRQPPKRRWFLGLGAVAVVEGLRRWFDA